MVVLNSSLPGGDNEYNLSDELMQALEVGLPVYAWDQIRLDLYSIQVSGASAGGSGQIYLGTFLLVLDPTTDELVEMEQLFLPLIAR